MSDLPERVGYTVMFLHMTATEMLKLADDNPEIAHELGRIADQLQAEAVDLAGHSGIKVAIRRRQPGGVSAVIAGC
jgi:nucleotide-binding universal stress UspA family protein